MQKSNLEYHSQLLHITQGIIQDLSQQRIETWTIQPSKKYNLSIDIDNYQSVSQPMQYPIIEIESQPYGPIFPTLTRLKFQIPI